MFSFLLRCSLSVPIYSLSAKDLIISGDGDIDSAGVKSKGSTQNVIRVIIKNGPTCIKNSAFYEMWNLEYVEIPESITVIEKQPFAQCAKLTTIIVAKANQHFCSEDNYLYTKNKALLIRVPVKRNLVIPEGVQSIQEYAFRASDFEYGDLVLPTTLTTLCSHAFYNSDFDTISFRKGSQLQVLHSFVYGHAKTLIIPPSVTKLGEYAFNFGLITNITFEEGSKLTEICNSAFQYFRCDTLILPDSVEKISWYAFKESSLKTIYIGSKCSNISSTAFAGCKSLVNVTISKDNKVYTSEGGVKSENELIFIPPSSTTLHIPKTITIIGQTMLQSSANLETITLDQDDTYWKTKDGVLYADNCKELVAVCGGVKSVEADANVIKVRSYAAYGCKKLTSFKFLGTAINEIGSYSFASSGLTSFDLPKTVKQLESHTFEDTAQMVSCTMDADSPVTYIGYYCFHWSHISSFVLGKNVETLITGAFFQCYYLNSFTFPSDSKLSYIQEYAFEGDPIKNLVLPASLTKLDRRIFQFCHHLEKVEFKETQSLTLIREFDFGYCENLKEVILPQSLTTLEQHAFISCVKLTSVKHNLETIGNSAFQSCVSLENFNFSKRQSKTYLNPSIFMKCYNLMNFYFSEPNAELIDLNGSVYSTNEEILYIFPPGREIAKIPPKTVKFAANAFAWSTKLKFVAFYSNSHLSTIGTTAFYECVNLKIVQFPSELVTLENECFSGCTSLTSILLPSSLNTIGEGSFLGCTNLRFVKYCGTNEITGTKVFENYAVILVTDLYPAPNFCSKKAFNKLSYDCELKPEFAPTCGKPLQFYLVGIFFASFFIINN